MCSKSSASGAVRYVLNHTGWENAENWNISQFVRRVTSSFASCDHSREASE
jgi:hypothetical protein